MNVLSFEFQNIAIKIIIIVTVCALRIWELYIVLVTSIYWSEIIRGHKNETDREVTK